MRKEVLFAIITGAALGLIVAFGIWRANGVITNSAPVPGSSPTPRALQTPPPSPRDATGQLTLLSPLNEEVIVGETVTISGNTKGQAWIVSRSASKVTITQADANGAFTQAFPISVGNSSITVTAFETSGQAYETQVTVVGTSAVPAAGATKPSAYLGTVTDKTENGIQIKASQGEIKQASVTSPSEVVRLGNPNKTLQFADVAIGDYVVAIGYKAGTGVLDTKRIYVTSSAGVGAKANFGTVSRLSKKDFDIYTPNGETITVPSSTDLSISQVGDGAKLTTKKFADIAISDTVIRVDKTIFIVATTQPTPKASTAPSASPKATPKPSSSPKPTQ